MSWRINKQLTNLKHFFAPFLHHIFPPLNKGRNLEFSQKTYFCVNMYVFVINIFNLKSIETFIDFARNVGENSIHFGKPYNMNKYQQHFLLTSFSIFHYSSSYNSYLAFQNYSSKWVLTDSNSVGFNSILCIHRDKYRLATISYFLIVPLQCKTRIRTLNSTRDFKKLIEFQRRSI